MSRAANLLRRRLLLLLPLMLGITLLVFIAIQLMPGDPATSALGVFASQAARERFAIQNHLHDPLWLRYPRFLLALLHGDLGVSLLSGASVAGEIAAAFPVTLQLTALALFFAVIAALATGIACAVRPNSWFDNAFRALSIGGIALPSFWIGLLAIALFAVRLGWLPSGGYRPISEGFAAWFSSLLLPAVTLAIPVASQLARIVRASMLEELEKDYVRTARGAGIPEMEVLLVNVLRNAMVTPLTALGLRFGALLAGAVLTETIFSIPGMGRLLIDAVQQGDLAVIQGVMLVNAATFLIVNLLVDALHLLLDPRMAPA